MDIQAFIRHYQQRCDTVMASYITPDSEDILQQAMSYAVFAGGKRLRPLLVYAAGTLHQVPEELLDIIAVAVEFIHTYSLIHDDLPAMDDDELRRGKPACHIAYGEATAILAGDALQCLAFELLSGPHASFAANIQLDLLHTLAKAIGYQGMAGGQMLDLAASGKAVTLEQLNRIHYLKTGALIQASILMGAKAHSMVDEHALAALTEFGYWLGLGFQIRDDILDMTGTTEQLGKPQGSDHLNDKTTYPVLLGLEQAEAKAQDCFDRAATLLQQIPGHTELLYELGRYLIIRAA